MGDVEYRYTAIGVKRLSDGFFIPQDVGNKDWQSYLEWVKEGGETLPQSTPEEVARDERRWRNDEFERIKWLRERHRDETELVLKSTLTDDQFSELLAYMQALREWPQSEDFPDVENRPVAPAWIAKHIRSVR